MGSESLKGFDQASPPRHLITPSWPPIENHSRRGFSTGGYKCWMSWSPLKKKRVFFYVTYNIFKIHNKYFQTCPPNMKHMDLVLFTTRHELVVTLCQSFKSDNSDIGLWMILKATVEKVVNWQKCCLPKWWIIRWAIDYIVINDL